MRLYNSSLSQIEYDDDDGSGNFSRIDRVCETDALPAGTYYVKVDEYGNNNEIQSYSLRFTRSTCPPPVPTPYSISNSDGDGNYSVNWSSSSGATSYELHEQLNSGSWSSVYTGSGRSQSRTGRSSGTWCYRVRASNSSGSSNRSSTRCTTVRPPTSTLYSISNSDGDGNYSVSWSSSSGATSYELHEQLNSGSWSSVYTGPSRNQSLTGRSPGTWCYRVRASNSSGSSNRSSSRCTTVDIPPPTLNNISNSDGDGNYSVSWSSSSGATSYELHEQLNSGSWSSVYTGPSRNQSLTGRSPGTWCYRVRASNSSGSSNRSSSRCTTVDIPPPTLNNISNSDGDGNYSVSWSSSSGVTSYELHEQLNSGSWSSVYTGSSRSQSLTGRSPGTWCYRVCASNSSGSSNRSSSDVPQWICLPMPSLPLSLWKEQCP